MKKREGEIEISFDRKPISIAQALLHQDIYLLYLADPASNIKFNFPLLLI